MSHPYQNHQYQAAPYGSTDQFPPSSGSHANLAGYGEKRQDYTWGAPSGKRGVSKWIKFGIPVAVLIIAGAVLGGVFGSRAANNNSNKSLNDAAAAQNGGSSTSSNSGAMTGAATGAGTGGGRTTTPASTTSTTSATTTTTTTSPTSTAGQYTVTNRAAWDWSKDKSIGMCLGNWLILERWMNEDWFVQVAGNSSLDEWTLSSVLGDQLQTVMEEHYNTWITEADFDIMQQTGINMIRIPTGYWAWVTTVAGEPYLNNQTALQFQISKVLGWAYARGMYAVIDLHGLPGSQNGEQSSGHLTTTPAWFGNTVNQGRSDDTVKAVTDYIAASPFRSIIAGIEVINEPRPYSEEQNQEIMSYYERSYQTIQASAWPVTTFIHDAYINFSYWQEFASQHATNPPSMVIEDHPYPGNFPPQTDATSIMAQICSAAQRYLNYPIPVVITEFSLMTGIKTTAFEKEFYEAQLVTWAWSAGGMYWSYRLVPSQQQIQQGLNYTQYSFIDLVNAGGIIPQTSDFGISSTSSRSNALKYLDSLSSNCGTAPNNVAPYPAATATWTAETSVRSAAGKGGYTAVSVTDTNLGADPPASATGKSSSSRMVKRSIYNERQ